MKMLILDVKYTSIQDVNYLDNKTGILANYKPTAEIGSVQILFQRILLVFLTMNPILILGAFFLLLYLWVCVKSAFKSAAEPFLNGLLDSCY